MDLPTSTVTENDEEDAEPRAKGDGYIEPEPELFALLSEREFLTLTGKYKGVPVSIVAIGMGAPNMNFFVRECKEILDDTGLKDMIIIRYYQPPLTGPPRQPGHLPLLLSNQSL